MYQEEGSIFWEVIVSAILSEIIYMYTCPIPVSEIQLFHCTVPKLLISKRYYVLFLYRYLRFK
jgi:hypothetical protein